MASRNTARSDLLADNFPDLRIEDALPLASAPSCTLLLPSSRASMCLNLAIERGIDWMGRTMALFEERAEAFVPFFQNREGVTHLFCDAPENVLWFRMCYIGCRMWLSKVLPRVPGDFGLVYQWTIERDLFPRLDFDTGFHWPKSVLQYNLDEWNRQFFRWREEVVETDGASWNAPILRNRWPHQIPQLRDLCTRVVARRDMATNSLPLELKELVRDERAQRDERAGGIQFQLCDLA